MSGQVSSMEIGFQDFTYLNLVALPRLDVPNAVIKRTTKYLQNPSNFCITNRTKAAR